MLAVGVGAALVLLPGGAGDPEPALATHGKICGVVAKGKNDFQVLGRRISCKKARKGSRNYLKRKKALRGFKCKRNVGPYRFVAWRFTNSLPHSVTSASGSAMN